MSLLEAALEETASYPLPAGLSTFESHIDPDWIEQALLAHGVATVRRRRLPAEQVVWLVLGMALMRDRPIDEVVAKLDLALPDLRGSPSVGSSAVAQARQRVGPEPIRWLFERCAREWALASAAAHRWHGLSVFALDGSTLRVADSEANRNYFGKAGGARGPSAYPLVRIVTLIAARSHLIAAARFGPYAKSEHEYAESLWDDVPAHSVTLFDRNFLSAKILLGLQKEPCREWLLRAKSNTTWRVKKKLAPNDLIVELDVSKTARQRDPALPETFQARAVRYRIDKRKPPQWLLTSMTDATRYPAGELVALYHERWEIEIAYDEIKTHQLDRQETLRSRSIHGVTQELWGILLTYNLVRLEMQRIAIEGNVAPSRISFVAAMRFIRSEWEWCALARPGTIPDKLRRMRENIAALILPPRRSERRYPRAVKIKMSSYPKKRSIPARRTVAK